VTEEQANAIEVVVREVLRIVAEYGLPDSSPLMASLHQLLHDATQSTTLRTITHFDLSVFARLKQNVYTDVLIALLLPYSSPILPSESQNYEPKCRE